MSRIIFVTLALILATPAFADGYISAGVGVGVNTTVVFAPPPPPPAPVEHGLECLHVYPVPVQGPNLVASNAGAVPAPATKEIRMWQCEPKD